MKERSYNYTPPMGHTACTEPQCLFKGALYLFYLVFYEDMLKPSVMLGFNSQLPRVEAL
jgi:hypothetical protein